MMIINKQDEVSTEGGNVLIYLIQMEGEVVGDYGDYVRTILIEGECMEIIPLAVIVLLMSQPKCVEHS